MQYGLAVDRSLQERFGVSATVVNARFAKPLDLELLRTELPDPESSAPLKITHYKVDSDRPC